MINDNFSKARNDLVRSGLPGPLADKTMYHLRAFLDDPAHKSVMIELHEALSLSIFVDMQNTRIVKLVVQRLDPAAAPLNMDLFVNYSLKTIIEYKRLSSLPPASLLDLFTADHPTLKAALAAEEARLKALKKAEDEEAEKKKKTGGESDEKQLMRAFAAGLRARKKEEPEKP